MIVAVPLLLIVSNFFYPTVSDNNNKVINNNEIITDYNEPQEVQIEVQPEAVEEKSNTFIANVSWYTVSADECGSDSGITASGRVAVAGRTVAADHLPLGTRVRINGNEYVVEDRFGGGYTDRIDIFCDTKEEAFANGRQYLEVEVLG